jgi:hypothetical protein
MMDNLKTSLLFRMLDLMLRVLAWGSAPRVSGETSPLGVRWHNVKSHSREIGQCLVQTCLKLWQWSRSQNTVSDETDDGEWPSKDVPPSNLLTLSPKLVVKALTKAPLVDLLQIFSDCTLDEREHILSALRSAPLLGPEPRSLATPLVFNKDGNTLGIQGATVAESSLPESPRFWHEPDSRDPLLTGLSVPRPEVPPGEQGGLPRILEGPPDQTWDDENPFEKFLTQIKKPISDAESGMGIDREAFLRWVDAEQRNDPPEESKWLAPLPLFEDLPKAPPSRELRSFVTGRDDWSFDDDRQDPQRPSSIHLLEEDPPNREAPPQSPPGRVLRSLPPEIPVARTTVKTLRERPEEWDEFQPLYNELSIIRKRFRDPDSPSLPSNRAGASPLVTPETVWNPSSEPPHSVPKDRNPLPRSSPGRGSPPEHYRSGGPPPVPIPRRGRRLSSPKGRNTRDSRPLAERQISGPG